MNLHLAILIIFCMFRPILELVNGSFFIYFTSIWWEENNELSEGYRVVSGDNGLERGIKLVINSWM